MHIILFFGKWYVLKGSQNKSNYHMLGVSMENVTLNMLLKLKIPYNKKIVFRTLCRRYVGVL